MEASSMADQLESFHASLIDQGMSPCEVPRNWIQAFGLLKRFLKASSDERKVVFIDELPWMDTPRAKFVSALENFWNGWCSARKDIVLIVCGSATSWMIKKVLKNKGGLFNRANRVIYLKPFTLGECEAYAHELGLPMGRRELAEGYMVFGGAPYYWSLLDRSLSLAQNIDRLCFTQGGELTVEFKRLYASVFKRFEKHVKIVEVLGSRKSGMSREEIVSAVGLKDSGKLSRILEELEESGFIRIYSPLGRVKRGSIYQLVDNLTLFHFRFVRENRDDDRRFWSNSADSPVLRAWQGLSFELVCLEHVEQMKQALQIGGVHSRNYAWQCRHPQDDTEKGAQIDLLIDRDDGIVNLCEMKFAGKEYALTSADDEAMRSKKAAFKRETRTRKAVHVTYVTTFGLSPNCYAGEVQSEVTLDDLFR